jgi:hypothetical protein
VNTPCIGAATIPCSTEDCPSCKYGSCTATLCGTSGMYNRLLNQRCDGEETKPCSAIACPVLQKMCKDGKCGVCMCVETCFVADRFTHYLCATHLPRHSCTVRRFLLGTRRLCDAPVWRQCVASMQTSGMLRRRRSLHVGGVLIGGRHAAARDRVPQLRRR